MLRNFRSENEWFTILWVTGLEANLGAKVLITDELELVQVLGCESEIVELGFKSLLGVL